MENKTLVSEDALRTVVAGISERMKDYHSESGYEAMEYLSELGIIVPASENNSLLTDNDGKVFII